MYNENTKQWYMELKKKSYSVSITGSMFKKTQYFEEKYDKDVSNFSKFEIVDMYKALNIYSFNSLINMNSMLKQYTYWAIKNNIVLDGQNHFEEITEDVLVDLINPVIENLRYIDRNELNVMEGKLHNASDIFSLECLYAGIKGNSVSEIVNIRYSDIDKKNKIIHLYTGRDVPVNDKVIESAQESMRATHYYPYTLNQRPIKLEDPDYVVRFKKLKTESSIEQRNINLYRRILKITEIVDKPWLNIHDIYESGLITYINRRCVECGINAEEFMGKYSDEIERLYGFKPANRWRFLKKHKERLAGLS